LAVCVVIVSAHEPQKFSERWNPPTLTFVLSVCELEKRKLAESEMKGNLICDVKRNNDDKCLLQAVSTVVELATSASAFRNSQRSAHLRLRNTQTFLEEENKTCHHITRVSHVLLLR
jgi:hypothetical protein